MAHHDVNDKDHWLASPRGEQFFGPLGVTNIRTFVDPENPTRVGLVMDVPDMEAVMAAMETEAARDSMAYEASYPRRWCSSQRRNSRNLSSNRRRDASCGPHRRLHAIFVLTVSRRQTVDASKLGHERALVAHGSRQAPGQSSFC